MSRFKRIVILTGAGISAEFGIATFRDKDGIWSKVNVEDVATPEAFARNPQRVLDFYNARRNLGAGAKPNAAHVALARLESEHAGRNGGQVVVVTQNVDPLHEMAGTRNLIHMHGEYCQTLCNHCQARHPWGIDEPPLAVGAACAACAKAGGVRPDIVWFGEMPYHMDRIYAGTGAGRPVRVHRHQRQRLSGRRFRRRGPQQRCPHRGAQSRAIRRRIPVPRGP